MNFGFPIVFLFQEQPLRQLVDLVECTLRLGGNHPSQSPLPRVQSLRLPKNQGLKVENLPG